MVMMCDILEWKPEQKQIKKVVASKTEISKVSNDILINYSDLLRQTPCIYRGGHFDRGKIYHINPALQVRNSQNTSNEMIYLVSTLRNWSEYPKRTRSIICGGKNTNYLTQFGNAVYAVLPKNGSKIGVCRDFDFWLSFIDLPGHVDEFNGRLNFLFSKFNKKYNENNYDSFISTLKEINSVLTELGNQLVVYSVDEKKEMLKKLSEIKRNNDWMFNEYDEGFYPKKYLNYRMYTRNNMSFVNYLANLIDPSKNGFKLFSTKNFPQTGVGSKEIWTDGPCYLVPINVYKDLYKLKVEHGENS